MKLSSPASQHEGTIPEKYTCDGGNINPPLIISSVPSGALSLALIMDDPDVPKDLKPDGMWDHWIVFNIPPGLSEIKEGDEPEGTHGMGSSQNLDYFGPCPPDREHRYFFKLYALDTKLDLPEKSGKQEVESAMKGHILAETELMGRYNRS